MALYESLSSQSWVSWTLYGSVFLFSLVSSTHCIFMCGGVSYNTSKKQQWSYHMGRLAAYLGVALMLALGFQLQPESKEAVFVFNVVIISLGVFLLFGLLKSLFGWKTSVLPASWRKSYLKNILNYTSGLRRKGNSGFLGATSVLMPCGPFYLLAFFSLTAPSLLHSLTVMILFWLGTLPALILSRNLFEKLFQPFRFLRPQWLGRFFLILGLFSVGLRYLQTGSYSGEVQISPQAVCNTGLIMGSARSSDSKP